MGCFAQPGSSKRDSATSEVLFYGTATCRDADTNEIIAELDFRPISRTVTAKPWSDPTSNPLDDLKAAQRLVAGASGAQANLIIMGRSAGDAFEAKYQREGSLQQAFHHTRLARSQDAKRSWRIQRVYGILLDANVDTAQAFSDSSVTGSIARAGSFKGPKLIVGVGTNVSTLTDALRKNGIYVEGAIVAPLAAAMPSEAETPAPAETEATPTA